MAIINPHINFNGNAEEAFTFYKSIFGGELTKIVRFKDVANEHFQVSKDEENKLMNIALPIGKENMLLGNDVPSFMGTTNEQENRSKISITAESKEEAVHLFRGLSEGATVEVPLSESAVGYFGMLRDKYGIEWMVNFEG